MPNWAINLKSGEYTIEYLVNLTGENYRNIYQFMARHCKKNENQYTNIKDKVVVIFNWKNPNGEV